MTTTASFTDSRLGPGTLVLSTTDFAAQMTDVKLEPDVEEVEGTPTLAEPEPDSTLKPAKWSVSGTAIDDHASTAGFVEFCRLHHGQKVAFEWYPSLDDDQMFTGLVRVKALGFGGKVGEQNTTDFEFRVYDLARVNA